MAYSEKQTTPLEEKLQKKSTRRPLHNPHYFLHKHFPLWQKNSKLNINTEKYPE